MPYETSYDAGLHPYHHDAHRGKWASPMDFLFACIGHAFKIDAMFVLPSVIFQDVGFYALVPYFIIMVVCTIPIVFMQSFLGQFSSTGFISVFRIAPLFKGIGYVSLAINITILTYYSLFAAIPFLYFLHSFRPTLPWSCEGIGEWSDMDVTENIHCNKTELGLDKHVSIQLPSLDFFRKHLNLARSENWVGNNQPDLTYSWSLIMCTLVIWICVWAVLRKPTEMIGRIIRYTTLAMLTILTICCLRFLFLPGAIKGLNIFISPPVLRIRLIQSILGIPIMALSGLGPGWGSILTMGSYNKFKTDITKYSWAMCLGQFVLMMLTSFTWIFVENFLRFHRNVYIISHHSQWSQFMAIPTALAFMEMSNFWSLLYFGMMTLGAMSLLIVQLFSVLTSLFDEYERLRRSRQEVIGIAVGVLALGSILFCSNHGIAALEFTSIYSVLTQMLLNLLLLLVVLWVYGRERFQRDLHFMTSRTYYTWMVYIVRFIAPIALIVSFLVALLIIVMYNYQFNIDLVIIATFIIVLPWLLIPGYCVFKIMQTSGMLGIRFKRSVRPTDWYPADPVDRQRYEETFGNPEISHQLTTRNEETVP